MREGVGLGVGVGVAGENEPAGAEGGTMRGVARLMRGEETTAGIAVGSPDSSMPGAASRFWDGPKAAGVVRGGELGLSGEGVPRGEEPVGLIGEGGWGLMGEGALGVTGLLEADTEGGTGVPLPAKGGEAGVLVPVDWLVMDAVVFTVGLLSVGGEGRRGEDIIESGGAGGGGADCGGGKNQVGEGGAEGGGGGEAGVGVGVCTALLPAIPGSPEF